VNGNNQSMFCATETSIFDISSSVFSFLVDDASNELVDDLGNALIDSSLAAALSGLTGGDWSAVQFATTGGVFLDLVNGSDKKLIYDGSNFYPLGTSDLISLDYDAETSAFTAGATLTGGTSSATGIIVKVIDNGTTGTLWLDSVTGTFQDNETITDDARSPTMQQVLRPPMARRPRCSGRWMALTLQISRRIGSTRTASFTSKRTA
jgi:hypothetical protein